MCRGGRSQAFQVVSALKDRNQPASRMHAGDFEHTQDDENAVYRSGGGHEETGADQNITEEDHRDGQEIGRVYNIGGGTGP